MKISESTRQEIIKLHEEGKTNKEIAYMLRVRQAIVGGIVAWHRKCKQNDNLPKPRKNNLLSTAEKIIMVAESMGIDITDITVKYNGSAYVYGRVDGEDAALKYFAPASETDS